MNRDMLVLNISGYFTRRAGKTFDASDFTVNKKDVMGRKFNVPPATLSFASFLAGQTGLDDETILGMETFKACGLQPEYKQVSRLADALSRMRIKERVPEKELLSRQITPNPPVEIGNRKANSMSLGEMLPFFSKKAQRKISSMKASRLQRFLDENNSAISEAIGMVGPLDTESAMEKLEDDLVFSSRERSL